VILYDVITVGSNTIDVFVKTDVKVVHKHHAKSKKVNADEFCLAYPVGEKILINHLEFQVGGGGTNTAVSFARLGLKTAYLGKIGDDENGVKVFRLLKKEKIKFIGPLGKSNGYSVILDSIKEDRTILTHKGCNDSLSKEELHKSFLKTKWFYFSSMIGKSLETLKFLATYAKNSGIKLAFNPSSYLTKKGPEHIKEILQATNVLIMNKEEGCYLTNTKNINSILKKLKKYATDYVVITDGAKGAYCFDGKKRYFGAPKKNIEIHETTGAGDAFASAFVAGLIRKKDIKTAMKKAFIQAESVIQAYGAKNDLLTNKKIIALLKKDRRKIEIKNM